jgi:hypothetical protein
MIFGPGNMQFRGFRPASARPILRWRWGAKRSCPGIWFSSLPLRQSLPVVAVATDRDHTAVVKEAIEDVSCHDRIAEHPTADAGVAGRLKEKRRSGLLQKPAAAETKSEKKA